MNWPVPTLMHVILSVGFIAVAVTFWNAHRRTDVQFNALDLVMENGRVSRIAVAFMLVLGVTTWVIVDLQIKGALTEAYFLAYSGAWIAPLVARVVFNKSEPPTPPDSKG